MAQSPKAMKSVHIGSSAPWLTNASRLKICSGSTTADQTQSSCFVFRREEEAEEAEEENRRTLNMSMQPVAVTVHIVVSKA